MARLLVASRSMALALRLADAHEIVEHPVDGIEDVESLEGIDVVVLDLGDPRESMRAIDVLRGRGDTTPVLVVPGYQPEWADVVPEHRPDLHVVSLPITRAALLQGIASLLGGAAPGSVASLAAAAPPPPLPMPQPTSARRPGARAVPPAWPAPALPDARRELSPPMGVPSVGHLPQPSAFTDGGEAAEVAEVAEAEPDDAEAPAVPADTSTAPDVEPDVEPEAAVDVPDVEAGAEAEPEADVETTDEPDPAPEAEDEAPDEAPAVAEDETDDVGTEAEPEAADEPEPTPEPAAVVVEPDEPLGTEPEEPGYEAAFEDPFPVATPSAPAARNGEPLLPSMTDVFPPSNFVPAERPPTPPHSRRRPLLNRRRGARDVPPATPPTSPAQAQPPAPAAGTPSSTQYAPPDSGSIDLSALRDARLNTGPLPIVSEPANPYGLDDATLVRMLHDRLDRLFGVADTAQALADDVTERGDADAAAVLVPDGAQWRVVAGVGLRPLERRLVLDTSHWLVDEVVVGGKALLVEDTDIVRQKLAGAPLAAWRHLMGVPVPDVRAAVILARGQDAGPFTEADLTTVVAPVREASVLLAQALEVRRLARRLDPLRELDDRAPLRRLQYE